MMDNINKKIKISVIHGPNLNLLGIREPNIYGNMTLDVINQKILDCQKIYNVEFEFFQSNIEGEIINKLHFAYENNFNGIIINPGAYTHTSYAISDAISSINTKVIEVHLSNIYSRENFRQKSVTSKNCIGIISGFGYYSYILAVHALINQFS